MAFAIFAALRDDMGGLNWSALPLFVALYGVEDPEMLIARLLTLKAYKREPPKE